MIIKNGNIVTWSEPNQILEGHEILVEDGIIKSIEPEGKLTERYPQEEVLDAQGQLIMPGNICAHTHFYGAFSRGWQSLASRQSISSRSSKNCGGNWTKRLMKKAPVILR